MAGDPGGTTTGSSGSWELLCKVTDEELKKTKIPILFAAVTGSGEAILTGSSRPRLQVWRLGEGEVTHAGTLKANAAPSCIECGDQNHVAVATQNGQIFLYDLREPQRPSLSLPSTMAEATAAPQFWWLASEHWVISPTFVKKGIDWDE